VLCVPRWAQPGARALERDRFIEQFKVARALEAPPQRTRQVMTRLCVLWGASRPELQHLTLEPRRSVQYDKITCDLVLCAQRGRQFHARLITAEVVAKACTLELLAEGNNLAKERRIDLICDLPVVSQALRDLRAVQ
jgi:hypothetical protein